MFKGQFHAYSSLRHLFWNGIIFCNLILSTSHDTWWPHSCLTMLKQPFFAALGPQILAGALYFFRQEIKKILCNTPPIWSYDSSFHLVPIILIMI